MHTSKKVNKDNINAIQLFCHPAYANNKNAIIKRKARSDQFRLFVIYQPKQNEEIDGEFCHLQIDT